MSPDIKASAPSDFEYKIVLAHCTVVFEREVKKLLGEGWSVLDDHQTIHCEHLIYFAQCLTRPKCNQPVSG